MMRLALIGRGAWGQKIERALGTFSDVELQTVARGAEAGDVDAVLIATPSASHVEVALPYVQKGIPAFIEKPLATTIADADRLAECARSTGTLVFVGLLYTHHAAFQRVRAAMPEIGRVQLITCEGMNANPRTDSSVLHDWLPHQLSMTHTLLQISPSSVEARCVSKTKEGLPEVAIATFHFGAVPVTCTVSWASPYKRMNMTIVGKKGTLIFDDTRNQKVSLCEDGGKRPLSYNEEAPLTRELRAFIDAVKNRKKHDDSFDLAMNITKEIAAAEESIRTGGITVTIQ